MAPSVTSAAAPRHDFFRRTKLCRYYLQGGCDQEAFCRFAHGEADLARPPGLTCARLCRELTAAGACSRPGCTYAHSRGELRGRKRELRAAALQAEAAARHGTDADAGAAKDSVDDEEVVFAFVVRRTLLELVPVAPTPPPRRARSLSLGRREAAE